MVVGISNRAPRGYGTVLRLHEPGRTSASTEQHLVHERLRVSPIIAREEGTRVRWCSALHRIEQLRVRPGWIKTSVGISGGAAGIQTKSVIHERRHASRKEILKERDSRNLAGVHAL